MTLFATFRPRRLPWLCAALGLVLLSFASAAQAATLDEIKKRGYLIVATEDDYRPFEFVKDGKPTGFNNELLEMPAASPCPSRSGRRSFPGPACSPASAPASTTWP